MSSALTLLFKKKRQLQADLDELLKHDNNDQNLQEKVNNIHKQFEIILEEVGEYYIEIDRTDKYVEVLEYLECYQRKVKTFMENQNPKRGTTAENNGKTGKAENFPRTLSLNEMVNKNIREMGANNQEHYQIQSEMYSRGTEPIRDSNGGGDPREQIPKNCFVDMNVNSSISNHENVPNTRTDHNLINIDFIDSANNFGVTNSRKNVNFHSPNSNTYSRVSGLNASNNRDLESQFDRSMYVEPATKNWNDYCYDSQSRNPTNPSHYSVENPVQSQHYPVNPDPQNFGEAGNPYTTQNIHSHPQQCSTTSQHDYNQQPSPPWVDSDGLAHHAATGRNQSEPANQSEPDPFTAFLNSSQQNERDLPRNDWANFQDCDPFAEFRLQDAWTSAVANDNRNEASDNRGQMGAGGIQNGPYVVWEKPPKIPTFEGDRAEFASFMFLVYKRIHLKNEEPWSKLSRLRMVLGKVPKYYIRHLGSKPNDYYIALNILKNEYGQNDRFGDDPIREIEEFPKIQRNDLRKLQEFRASLRLVVGKLHAEGWIGELTGQSSGSLLKSVLQKLPDSLVFAFYRNANERSINPNIAYLNTWLENYLKIEVQAQTMLGRRDQNLSISERGARGANISSEQGSRGYSAPAARLNYASGRPTQTENRPINQEQQIQQNCETCQASDHKLLTECAKFTNSPVGKRWDIATARRVCYGCLNGKHSIRLCKLKKTCEVNECKKYHHPMLHNTNDVITNTRPVSTSDTSDTRTSPTEDAANIHVTRILTSSTPHDTNPNFSLRTFRATLDANGRKIDINCMLDDGANRCILTEDACRYLGFDTQRNAQPFEMHTAGKCIEVFTSTEYKVQLMSCDGTYQTDLVVQSCPHRIPGDYEVIDWSIKKNSFNHLRDCIVHKPAEPKVVDLVIGVNRPDLHTSYKELVGNVNEPVGRMGPLGVTIVGKVLGNETRTQNSKVHFNTFSLHDCQKTVAQCCDIDSTIKTLWEQSEPKAVDRREIMTAKQQKAIEILNNTLEYDETIPVYEVGTTWEDGPPSLENNRDITEKKFYALERRLEKNPELYNEYSKVIDKEEEKGYIEIVSPEEEDDTECLLSHFPVIRRDRQTTKCRKVVNASESINGDYKSLNDYILIGPALQANGWEMMIRFRRRKIAVVCDIQEMFMRILNRKDERKYFRFLWRKKRTDPLRMYQFTRVIFGVACAPLQANFVAQEHARRNLDKYPAAANAVLNNTYVDDMMVSVQTEKEGVELYHQSIELWSGANMNPRKWMSNSQTVRDEIPAELLAEEKFIECCDTPATKTLGLVWQSKPDTFQVSTSQNEIEDPITKRKASGVLGALYDPPGFVSPFTLQAKLSLRKMWERGYGWDDEVDYELAQEIKSWINQLPEIQAIVVPRCLSTGGVEKCSKLVCFTDASSDAIGVAIYLVIEYEDESISARLVTAKSKLSPTTPLTIPKLELSASVEGLRITVEVCRAINLSINEARFFTDSIDVVYWIRGSGKDFRPYIKFRVGEIQQLTSPSQWAHCKGIENPADLCTRKTSAKQLKDSELYWKGPDWLEKPETHWPSELPNKPDNIRELNSNASKQRVHIVDLREKDDEIDKLDPKRFSKYIRLRRVTAWILRWKYTVVNKTGENKVKYLTAAELDRAEKCLVKRVQRKEFANELHTLQKKQNLDSKHVLANMVPFLDEIGIMRVGGRIDESSRLTYDEKHPIIIPRKHRLTYLILDYYHSQQYHARGVNHVMSIVAQRFWCIALREAIRDVATNCYHCKRYTAKPSHPFMANLPKSRLGEDQRAYANTSVDLAGPYETKQGRGKVRAKRWVVVYTCMTTRATTLDIVFGADTDSFLRSLQRFVNRNSKPSVMRSDNGTNFVGAKNEIDMTDPKIQDHFAEATIKWALNPPLGPHFGGIHESIVKSMKRALPKTFENILLNDEELQTVISNVEAFLNTRPLTYSSSDPQDPVPLTPGHFIGVPAPSPVPLMDLDIESPPFKQKWKLVQYTSNELWKRFLRELLPTLNPRTKWWSKCKNLKKGDVVIVIDDKTTRGKWPLGKILETFPGKNGDETCRVAKVQIGYKVFTRPIVKLIPLVDKVND